MDQDRKVNIRLENLELRSCDKHLISSEKHTTFEIVCWNSFKNYCFTIAYWKDGNLSFVGERPLLPEVCDYTFQKLVKIGYFLIGLDILKTGEQ
jgi:hypothetical protein